MVLERNNPERLDLLSESTLEMVIDEAKSQVRPGKCWKRDRMKGIHLGLRSRSIHPCNEHSFQGQRSVRDHGQRKVSKLIESRLAKAGKRCRGRGSNVVEERRETRGIRKVSVIVTVIPLSTGVFFPPEIGVRGSRRKVGRVEPRVKKRTVSYGLENETNVP